MELVELDRTFSQEVNITYNKTGAHMELTAKGKDQETLGAEK